MKKIILSIILIIFLISLVGCGYEYGEIKGQVVDKKYTPSRVIPQVIYTGKSSLVIPIRLSESWEIEIQKENERRSKSNLGKCIKR